VIAYSKEHDDVESYKYFSEALLIAPNDYWSRIERAKWGRLPSEDGAASGKRAMTELDIAKTIRPDLPFASEFLVAFYSVEPERKKKELVEQIDRFGLDLLRAHDVAELLQKEGKHDEAKAILQRVLDQDIGGRTAEKIGDLEYRIGNCEQARQWYGRAISEGAKYAVAFARLADAFTAMKDLKAAEQAYLDGIAEHSEVALLYGQLAFWYEERGRLADAENTYRKGCEIHWDSGPEYSRDIDYVAINHQQLANLLMRLGRHAESVPLLQEGIARLEKGMAGTNVDEQKAQAVEFHIAELKGYLGRAYVYLGRRQDALSLVESQLKNKPFRFARTWPAVNLLMLLGMRQEEALVRELSALDQTWLKLNVRPNATLDCFSAWAALATGNEKRAFEKLVSAGPFFLQASRQSDFGGDEALACAITYQIVSEKLGESKRLAEASEFLKRFPGDRVETMRELFSIRQRK